jgi:hypothetical protein
MLALPALPRALLLLSNPVGHMLHYTCDGCGVRLKADSGRFVVTIDGRPGYPDDDIGGPADENDARDDLPGCAPDRASDERFWRFDFCPSCYEAYSRDPLVIFTLRRGHMRN